METIWGGGLCECLCAWYVDLSVIGPLSLCPGILILGLKLNGNANDMDSNAWAYVKGLSYEMVSFFG